MTQAREGWQAAGSGGADQGTVRRANLALVLGSLRESGARSRARLAGDLGLNKATVSSLVGELMERGLVREGRPERGAVGRPGTIVELNGSGAFGIGAEINVNHVTTLAVDLAGEVVSERKVSVDTRELEPKGHTTSPPSRYTEPSLVARLEELGIGRPSTYASIMQTIQDRGYVVWPLASSSRVSSCWPRSTRGSRRSASSLLWSSSPAVPSSRDST